MELRHHTAAGDTTTLATTVEYADTFLDQALGLIGTTRLPESYALVFSFSKPRSRTIHTVGVRTAIDVLWVVDENVTAVQTLPPWYGIGRSRADTVIECPAGAADAVTPGDRITIVD